MLYVGVNELLILALVVSHITVVLDSTEEHRTIAEESIRSELDQLALGIQQLLQRSPDRGHLLGHTVWERAEVEERDVVDTV